jgi:hypothetical protein
MRQIILAAMLWLISGTAHAATNGVSADHSQGVVILGSPAGAANCKAAITGAIRYNSTNPGLQYCDGTSWSAVGGMTFISTQTASASATLQFTNLPTSYNTLFLNCTGLQPASNGVGLQLQFGEGATPTWETSGYAHNGNESCSAGSGVGYLSNSDSAIQLIYSGDGVSDAKQNLETKIWMNKPGSTSIYKNVDYLSDEYYSGTFENCHFVGGGSYNADTNTLTALRIQFSTGNITSGTCSLYGMN